MGFCSLIGLLFGGEVSKYIQSVKGELRGLEWWCLRKLPLLNVPECPNYLPVGQIILSEGKNTSQWRGSIASHSSHKWGVNAPKGELGT